jgi:hypothetical protein
MNIRSIFTAIVAILTMTGCHGQNKQEVEHRNQNTMKRSIVIFFSHAGDNYAVGNIKVGNTKVVADYISEMTGAAQYEIVTHKYDGMAYNSLVELAKDETAKGELPPYEG